MRRGNQRRNLRQKQGRCAYFASRIGDLIKYFTDLFSFKSINAFLTYLILLKYNFYGLDIFNDKKGDQSRET